MCLFGQCYPGRQAYNDPNTSWCPVSPDTDHGEEENKRQRRSPSHDDYPDGFPGRPGDGPPHLPPGHPDDFPGPFGDAPQQLPLEYPDDSPGHFGDGPPRPPPGPHGPHRRPGPGPGRRHGRPNGRPGNWEDRSHKEEAPTTPNSGALRQQAKVGSCSLVTVEVFTSKEAHASGKTWAAFLYSGRKAAEDCNQVTIYSSNTSKSNNNSGVRSLNC